MANTVLIKMQCTRLTPAAAGGVGRVILGQIYDFDVTKHNALMSNERPSRQPRGRAARAAVGTVVGGLKAEG